MTAANGIRSVYAAILEYFDQAEAYLAGHTEGPPDANLLRRDHALPGGTILQADPGEDQHGPSIAAQIEYPDEDRNPRLFDPWDVPAIYLEEIAGVPLRWHRTVQKRKVYLRLMLTPVDRPASLGIPVARAIANSPLGMATLFTRGHKDIRRAALTFASAIHRPHPPKFGRDDAIQLACECFNSCGIADVLGVTPDAFKAQLERAYRIADAMHAKRYSEEAD
jgi:hypothetical protein